MSHFETNLLFNCGVIFGGGIGFGIGMLTALLIDNILYQLEKWTGRS